MVHFFDKLGLIENFGTGIQKTIDAYKNEDKHPEFKPSENFFIVSLPNLTYDDQINDQIKFNILKRLNLSILKIDLLSPININYALL